MNVSLFYSGETGSRKSENRHLAINTLLELSIFNPGKKGSKLTSQAPTTEFVIECNDSDGASVHLFHVSACWTCPHPHNFKIYPGLKPLRPLWQLSIVIASMAITPSPQVHSPPDGM